MSYTGWFQLKTQSSKDSVKISVGTGKHKVDMTIVAVNSGVVAIIKGGDSPHIGAVAIAAPRLSLKNPKTVSSTSSVITLTSHKDDEIARPISEKMAESLNSVVVVVAGVHIDKASTEDIELLVSNSMKCSKKAINQLKPHI